MRNYLIGITVMFIAYSLVIIIMSIGDVPEIGTALTCERIGEIVVCVETP